MAQSLIRTSPRLSWPALQTHTLRLAVTVRAGFSLTDYGTFTLTIRADPLWPRTGADRVAADVADPVGDGWAVSTTATGTIDGSDVLFTVTVPSASGEKRYALDAVATGGVAGRVELVPTTWLTVTPSLLA